MIPCICFAVKVEAKIRHLSQSRYDEEEENRREWKKRKRSWSPSEMRTPEKRRKERTDQEEEDPKTKIKGKIKKIKNTSAQDRMTSKILEPEDEEEDCAEGGLSQDQGQYIALRSHHQPHKSKGGGRDEEVTKR